MRKLLAISLGLVMLSTANAWEYLSMKQRSELIDKITVERFNSVLPQIMEREGIDMWVLNPGIQRRSRFKNHVTFYLISARRHTMLVIYNPGTSTANVWLQDMR